MSDVLNNLIRAGLRPRQANAMLAAFQQVVEEGEGGGGAGSGGFQAPHIATMQASGFTAANATSSQWVGGARTRVNYSAMTWGGLSYWYGDSANYDMPASLDWLTLPGDGSYTFHGVGWFQIVYHVTLNFLADPLFLLLTDGVSTLDSNFDAHSLAYGTTYKTAGIEGGGVATHRARTEFVGTPFFVEAGATAQGFPSLEWAKDVGLHSSGNSLSLEVIKFDGVAA